MRLAILILLSILVVETAARAEEPEDDPLAKGRALLRTARHDEGIAALRDVIRAFREKEPDATKLVWIGRAHFLLEEDGRAAEALGAATKLEPDNPWAHLWLGIVWKWVEPEKAVAPLREALRLDPEYGNAWYHLAVVLGRLDRDAEALKAILKALHHGVETASAHFHAGVQLAIAGREDEALAHYETAAALDPSHESARYNLGLAHYRAGRFKRALAAWKEAAALDEGDLQTHAQVMKALTALERHDEALKWRAKIFAIHAALDEEVKKESRSFIFDRFEVEEMQVYVREYFDQGLDRLYTIRFFVKAEDGTEFTVNLEPHAAYELLGGAMYVLGRNDASGHTTFTVEWAKRPSYPELKRAAIRAIRGETRAASSSSR